MCRMRVLVRTVCLLVPRSRRADEEGLITSPKKQVVVGSS